jgi:hypothetical protein
LLISRTAGDVSATPAVSRESEHGNRLVNSDLFLYFPDWGGRLWKVDAETGFVMWSRRVQRHCWIDFAYESSTRARAGPHLVISTSATWAAQQSHNKRKVLVARSGYCIRVCDRVRSTHPRSSASAACAPSPGHSAGIDSTNTTICRQQRNPREEAWPLPLDCITDCGSFFTRDDGCFVSAESPERLSFTGPYAL